MHSKILFALLLACGLLTGCVSNSGSLALEGAGSAGAPAGTVYSQKVHLLAAKVATPRFGRKLNELPSITLQVTNRGSEPFEFSPAKIEAFADSKPVKVYSVEDYVVLLIRTAQTERLLADAKEHSAEQQSRLSISAPSQPLLASQAEAALERMSIKERQAKSFASSTDMLRPKTVAPGETFGGTIRLQASPLLSAERLRLRVTVGTETHEVFFAVSR